MSEKKVKAERRHTRKLFNGMTTAEEVHRSAFPPDARCQCGSPKVAIRARTFYPMADLLEKRPAAAMAIAAKNGGRIPCVDFRGPGNRPVKYVKLGDAFACDLCKKALAKACAAGEAQDSAIITHIDNGPGPDKIIVPVG